MAVCHLKFRRYTKLKSQNSEMSQMNVSVRYSKGIILSYHHMVFSDKPALILDKSTEVNSSKKSRMTYHLMCN